MTNEVTIVLDGREFQWTHDPNASKASESWSWSDVQTFMTPPSKTVIRLNQLFIEVKALDVAKSLTVSDDPKRLHDVLRSMGAVDTDFSDDPLCDLLIFSTESRHNGTVNWPSLSPLRAMGYKVGDKGLPPNQRRAILRAAFESSIPVVGSAEYMAEWGNPGTPGRLKKIANYVASLCQNLKRKRQTSDKAIEDWENDLRWLKESFYDGFKWSQDTYYQEHFHWPSTIV
jgi:hypothetical protein